MRRHQHMIGWTAGALVALSGIAGCSMSSCSMDWQVESGQQSLTASATSGLLDIATDNGAVEVVQAPVSVIEIEATVRARSTDRLNATHVKAEAGPEGGTRIFIEWPGGRREGNEGCSLIVRVPSSHGVKVDTSNGRVTLEGLSGPASVETSNGSVTITRHVGPATVRTSNGRIEVLDGGAELHLTTSNGAIRAERIDGPVVARTSNGSVQIALSSGAKGPVDISTSNGAIKLQVGPGFCGAVDADTSNGSATLVGASGVQSGKSSARGNYGSGDVPCRLRSSNGRIEVTRAE